MAAALGLLFVFFQYKMTKCELPIHTWYRYCLHEHVYNVYSVHNFYHLGRAPQMTRLVAVGQVAVQRIEGHSGWVRRRRPERGKRRRQPDHDDG